MADQDPWIEDTADALRAKMRRGRSSNVVRWSDLLANHHLEQCKKVVLVSSHGEDGKQKPGSTSGSR
jgi:hypothetical protein